MEADFALIFSPDGEICKTYFDEIDRLSSDGINQYSDEIGTRLSEDVKKAWEDFTVLVHNRIAGLLEQYDNECQFAIPENVKITVNVPSGQDPEIKDLELRERVGKIRTEIFMTSAIPSAITGLLGGAMWFIPALSVAAPVLAPLSVAVSMGAILWGAISGNVRAKQERLQKNKLELKKFVQTTLMSCRKELVEVSLADKKYQSMYQGFMLTMRQQATDVVNDTYDRYKSELNAMKTAVVESKQDPEYIKAVEQLISVWSLNKGALNKVHAALESLNE